MPDAKLALQRIGLSPLQVIIDEIGRMRRALDAIYNDDAARPAVIKHYGLHHVDVSECVAALRKQLVSSESRSVTPDGARNQFEAAMREQHPEWSFTPDPVFGYHNERTRLAWEGWQAAHGVRPVDGLADWLRRMADHFIVEGGFQGGVEVADMLRWADALGVQNTGGTRHD